MIDMIALDIVAFDDYAGVTSQNIYAVVAMAIIGGIAIWWFLNSVPPQRGDVK